MAGPDKVNILMVDDQPGKLLSYEAILSELGENLIKATSGKEALEHLLKTDVAVVLMDVSMPELDGFALLQRLRELPRLATVPVILLTARASEEAAIEGLRAGADDYIAKPFSPRELLARLQATLGRARADAALRDSEAKFRATFETMIEACCIFDMVYDEQGRPVDWKILEANPGYRGKVWDFAPGADPADREIVARMRGRKLPLVRRVEISIISPFDGSLIHLPESPAT